MTFYRIIGEDDGAEFDEVIGFDVVPLTKDRSTTAERVNNAIVKLDFVARGSSAVSAGVKTAIHDLCKHWLTWFRGDYWSLPDVVYVDKMTRYVQWYTRAYMLLPQELRAGLAAPESLDTSFSAVVSDTIARVIDANEATGAAAADLAKDVTQSASSVALWVAAGALAALYFMGLRK